jgi:ferritin-like metal-binding protein YciE
MRGDYFTRRGNRKERKFEDLLAKEPSGLYDAERQICRSAAENAGSSSRRELADAFKQHLEETNEHVQRLVSIFSQMGEQPGGKQCEVMAGLLHEGVS